MSRSLRTSLDFSHCFAAGTVVWIISLRSLNNKKRNSFRSSLVITSIAMVLKFDMANRYVYEIPKQLPGLRNPHQLAVKSRVLTWKVFKKIGLIVNLHQLSLNLFENLRQALEKILKRKLFRATENRQNSIAALQINLRPCKRGLGLSELWVPGGTSVAGDRCPTQLFYTAYENFR